MRLYGPIPQCRVRRNYASLRPLPRHFPLQSCEKSHWIALPGRYIYSMKIKKSNPAVERLKEENTMLKMKLMLEHGAEFGGNKNPELPPELEHFFLNNMVELEETLASRPMTTVFRAIGSPTHFLPVSQIAEEDIQDAWNELRIHLNRYGVDLSACSPAVTPRELYRFTVEELFEHQMMALDLPGWRCNFIYDEFHPDPEFEAITRARVSGLYAIFSPDPIEDGNAFANDNLRLNLYHSLTKDSFVKIINRFKESFDDIILTTLSKPEAVVEDETATVKGSYRARCVLEGERIRYSGNWTVSLRKEETEMWIITGMEISGIEF